MRRIVTDRDKIVVFAPHRHHRLNYNSISLGSKIKKIEVADYRIKIDRLI
jgi:hypothetical protein